MTFYLNVSRMLSVKEQIIETVCFLWGLKAVELDTAVMLFISCFCIQTLPSFFNTELSPDFHRMEKARVK